MDDVSGLQAKVIKLLFIKKKKGFKEDQNCAGLWISHADLCLCGVRVGACQPLPHV